MLPTPSTSHVSFDRVYEPAEDSFLLLDTLANPSETAFLKERFQSQTSHGPPVVLEVGTGSGVVLAFITANATELFGHSEIISLGTDLNSYACQATRHTILDAIRDKSRESKSTSGTLLGVLNADLTSSIKPHTVDVLVFNPPYVPTEELPDMSKHPEYNASDGVPSKSAFERDSHLLALSYAGGTDGMEVTNRLLSQLPEVLHPGRGVAYILLCAQNRPEGVKEVIRNWDNQGLGRWNVETVGSSGKKAGWEKLQIVRLWRDGPSGSE